MSVIIYSILFFFFVAISIFARLTDRFSKYVFFKPITTIILIILAVNINLNTQTDYSLITIIALVFCLFGDVFLLFKRTFLYGLISFLIAHLFFTYNFTTIIGFTTNIIPLIILLIYVFVFFIKVYKKTGSYTFPILFYMLIIVLMGWQAINLFLHFRSLAYFFLMIAALLFMISDTIIAYKKFKKEFKYAELFILSFYWLSIYIFTITGFFI